MSRHLSFAAVAVLRALRAGHQHGFEIIDVTGLAGSTVYPTLAKLEDAGFVSSRWEAAATAQQQKRPPRRYYALRPAGERALTTALERYRALERMPLAPRRARG